MQRRTFDTTQCSQVLEAAGTPPHQAHAIADQISAAFLCGPTPDELVQEVTKRTKINGIYGTLLLMGMCIGVSIVTLLFLILKSMK